ncbi:hypothetical protein [Novosphingopyxis sp.]|uniref:hypothetical protein n=1 Tax=Novosphingopyxis sp. TaxID=2709690 RepID=UPI003B5C7308
MLQIFLPLVAVAAAATPSAHTDLPIKMIENGRGAKRFSVTIMVNGEPVEAALDTGSVGLRIVAPALPAGAKATGRKARIGFNSGVMLEGSAVRVSVAFAGMNAKPVTVQRIDGASCRKEVPRCDAAGVKLSAFRIMSDGIPGEGFSAILGIGLRDDPIGHPLVQVGIDRWIVKLPRTPEEVGHLILNPTDAEVANYRMVALLPHRNEIEGCLVTATKKLCAPTAIDSGAPAITLFGTSAEDIPESRTSAMLALGSGEDDPKMPIIVGDRSEATLIRARPARRDAESSMSFGIAPYMHWTILYNSRARTLGVANR